MFLDGRSRDSISLIDSGASYGVNFTLAAAARTKGGPHIIRRLTIDRTAQPNLLGLAGKVPAAERQISSARPSGDGIRIRSSRRRHPVAA
jgi:hypothetical protein